MNRNDITMQLTDKGYEPFLRPFLGSLIVAEAWANKSPRKKTVIFLYRKDTEDLIDLNELPSDEENILEVNAFVDDFRASIYRP
jgi:hypothetical protein